MIKKYSVPYGQEELIIETGKLAEQAGGAVTVRWGDAVLLVTATASKEPRSGIDFFPLRVDFEERSYAAGRIPGGFFKREGRPSSDSILICRKVDRPLRPLFPDGYRNDVQIIITSFSADTEHDLDMISLVGASAALIISDIPFTQPVGAVRVGYIDDEFVINPTISQIEESVLDLAVAGTKESVQMIDVAADEFPEELLLEGIRRGHEALQSLVSLQEQMREDVGKEKLPGVRETLPQTALDYVDENYRAKIAELVKAALSRDERSEQEAALQEEIFAGLPEDIEEKDASDAFDKVLKEVMRQHILDTGTRIDGRGLDEIRELSAEVSLFPRTHGSGLFTRGATQVVDLVTLGTSSDEQRIEGLTGESSKRFMHHYNFPPYSTGETWPLRSPGRREIGHGALAERAILPMLPSEEEFPYTIRAVSEALSSNGSTSMASTCAASLALFDAGVPMKAAVGGIAMGVITEGDRYAVLTDIQGLEDHLGDMDFKVTGTRKGITAIQLDIKISGLRYDIIEEALKRARAARFKILDVMDACIDKPREDLSLHAPRITTLQIPVDKIGALIGPGGKTIRSIIDETGVSINVEDDGTVSVASEDGESAAEAIRRIEELTAEPELGQIYTGRVGRTTQYGAFVEIMPGHDGLVHISQLADYRVPSVQDVVKTGDEIMVMVTDIGPGGKVRLSRQAVLEGWTLEEARDHDAKISNSGGSRRRRR